MDVKSILNGSSEWPDYMDYLPNMDLIRENIMLRVLASVESLEFDRYTPDDVRRALGARECTVYDFAALLSQAAVPFLEEVAQRARKETRARFGNSVTLFTPLYIANYCVNQCVYCGFNRSNRIKRARLESDELEREMRAIAASGLEEILILTGESPRMSNVAYISNACAIARKYFRVVGVEVYPMNIREYTALHSCGVDFVTVFQETYNMQRYGELHPGGRKRIFPYRFHAQERALMGGVRGVGFAVLLGLSDFRADAFATGLHALMIQKKYPHAEISFSCPRLRPIPGGSFTVSRDVSEAELFQVMCAYRIFMPSANITISSRESARFRDNVVGIAATKISAGVDVGVGRHAKNVAKGEEQFEIDDGRSVSEICEMLASRGLQPVMSEYIYV
ncbi:MAG: 2-iminoacetate synthase ThiH [Clostridiales Family XIII bacterium]|jgi:2-iminoacetate synthase|nr:2-iminoacetate synthase ThiH [Clostridiales Family XIII bacterium]